MLAFHLPDRLNPTLISNSFSGDFNIKIGSESQHVFLYDLITISVSTASLVLSVWAGTLLAY